MQTDNQATRDALLNDFAIRSFRDTADRDYIHARLAYRAHLIPQFLWSSLHCLEKYAKCVLILNRIRAPRGHQISISLRLLEEQGPFVISLSEQSAAFARRLERGAEFRYFETSYWNVSEDLVKLDRAVWEVRRYCQVLDLILPLPAGPKKMLDLNLLRIRRAAELNKKGTCIAGGLLEQILRKKTHPARTGLIWNNLYFGPSRRKRILLRGQQESGNGPLQMHPEIIDEALKYVHVPKVVIDALRGKAKTK